MPSFVGRQTGISLKGEVSNHKGNFDEAGNDTATANSGEAIYPLMQR
jgi:hypothetical protein